MRRMNCSPLLATGMTVAVTLVACIVAAGQDVRHHSMPGVDFFKYHTYKWIDIEATEILPQVEIRWRSKISQPAVAPLG
jgi:hypothetical protein